MGADETERSMGKIRLHNDVNAAVVKVSQELQNATLFSGIHFWILEKIRKRGSGFMKMENAAKMSQISSDKLPGMFYNKSHLFSHSLS